MLISNKAFDTKTVDQVFDDAIDWNLPLREHVHIGSDKHCDNFWSKADDGSKSGRRYRTIHDHSFPWF